MVPDQDVDQDDIPSNATAVKVGGIIMLFILPLIFGLIPLRAVKLRSVVQYTAIANCFGGGVFFGTCILHLIPEVGMQ